MVAHEYRTSNLMRSRLAANKLSSRNLNGSGSSLNLQGRLRHAEMNPASVAWQHDKHLAFRWHFNSICQLHNMLSKTFTLYTGCHFVPIHAGSAGSAGSNQRECNSRSPTSVTERIARTTEKIAKTSSSFWECVLWDGEREFFRSVYELKISQPFFNVPREIGFYDRDSVFRVSWDMRNMSRSGTTTHKSHIVRTHIVEIPYRERLKQPSTSSLLNFIVKRAGKARNQ